MPLNIKLNALASKYIFSLRYFNYTSSQFQVVSRVQIQPLCFLQKYFYLTFSMKLSENEHNVSFSQVAKTSGMGQNISTLQFQFYATVSTIMQYLLLPTTAIPSSWLFNTRKSICFVHLYNTGSVYNVHTVFIPNFCILHAIN